MAAKVQSGQMTHYDFAALLQRHEDNGARQQIAKNHDLALMLQRNEVNRARQIAKNEELAHKFAHNMRLESSSSRKQSPALRPQSPTSLEQVRQRTKPLTHKQKQHLRKNGMLTESLEKTFNRNAGLPARLPLRRDKIMTNYALAKTRAVLKSSKVMPRFRQKIKVSPFFRFSKIMKVLSPRSPSSRKRSRASRPHASSHSGSKTTANNRVARIRAVLNLTNVSNDQLQGLVRAVDNAKNLNENDKLDLIHAALNLSPNAFVNDQLKWLMRAPPGNASKPSTAKLARFRKEMNLPSTVSNAQVEEMMQSPKRTDERASRKHYVKCNNPGGGLCAYYTALGASQQNVPWGEHGRIRNAHKKYMKNKLSLFDDIGAQNLARNLIENPLTYSTAGGHTNDVANPLWMLQHSKGIAKQLAQHKNYILLISPRSQYHAGFNSNNEIQQGLQDAQGAGTGPLRTFLDKGVDVYTITNNGSVRRALPQDASPNYDKMRNASDAQAMNELKTELNFKDDAEVYAYIAQRFENGSINEFSPQKALIAWHKAIRGSGNVILNISALKQALMKGRVTVFRGTGGHWYRFDAV